jgi:nicotinamide mononucleotide (NMN) deamidase PncC
MRRAVFIRRIHAAPAAGVIVVAGGGSRLIADLLSVPGASATVLEARVPYAAAALAQFLGASPEQAVSATTACDIAMAAFERARELDPTHDNPFGVAVTASLRTRAAKRGEHRAHVAVQTLSATRVHSLILTKGARTRTREEILTCDFALQTMATALDIAGAPLPDLLPGETIQTLATEAQPHWRALMAGDELALSVGAAADPPRALMPGSFNPLHDGHRAMAAYARDRLRIPVAYELCIRNVDKPALNYLDMDARLAQFASEDIVYLTRLSTFLAKGRRFPGSTFLVGADTIVRIAQARYYGSAAARDAAFAELANLNCRFLVFGRRIDGQFVVARDLDLPQQLEQLCITVDAHEFRNDASSTALRRATEQ